MKGVSYITDYITDERDKKTAVVIDLNLFKKASGEIEDILDVIIAEARKDDKKIPLAEVKRQLKKAGKL
jgi:hypothetical protein